MDVASDVCMDRIEWRKFNISMINVQIFKILKRKKKLLVGKSELTQFISTNDCVHVNPIIGAAFLKKIVLTCNQPIW